jgi:hypothetical protein
VECDQRQQRAHEHEVERASGGGAHQPHRALDGEQRGGRHEHQRKREDDDLRRGRVANGEEGRVPAEDVEQRLREREGAKHREVDPVAEELARVRDQLLERTW